MKHTKPPQLCSPCLDTFLELLEKEPPNFKYSSFYCPEHLTLGTVNALPGGGYRWHLSAPIQPGEATAMLKESARADGIKAIPIVYRSALN